MNQKISPVAASLIFAAASAALMAAVAILPLRSIHRPVAANAAIFLCLAAYSTFLARSSGRSLRALFAPFLMLSAVLAVAGSVTEFVVPAAAGLAWVRSGICFPGPTARRVGAEALTGLAGLALVWLLQPPGACGWALGIWMFGILQALYFVIVDIGDAGPLEKQVPDKIAQARRRAEALLKEQRLARAFEELGL